MTAATDTLQGALDSHDRGVREVKSVGEHDAPISAMGSLREDDDLRLMAQVAAKDQQAITILYQRYAPRLRRFLSRSLKSDVLVDEAVNDTMLVVWRKAGQFDPDRTRLSTWLFGIAYHAGKALARSAKESCAPLSIGEERDHEEPATAKRGQTLLFFFRDDQRAHARGPYFNESLLPQCGAKLDKYTCLRPRPQVPCTPDQVRCNPNPTEAQAIVQPPLPPPPTDHPIPFNLDSTLRAKLVRCGRLLSSHVDAALVSNEVAACLEATRSANVLNSCTMDNGGSLLWQESRAANVKLWEQQLSLLTEDPSNLGGLGRQLSLFEKLYEMNRAVELATQAPEPGAAEPSALTGDTSRAIDKLFEKLNQRYDVTSKAIALAKPNASDAALRTALASASSAGNTMAKEVVKAASAPLVLDRQNRLPIGGVALLAVLGEALGLLSTQLDDLSTFHDFACTFRDCRPPVQRSPLAQAYSLLGTLHSRSSMGALLPVTKDGLDGWKNVFTSLNEQRSKLDSALEALGQPDLPTANTSKIPVAVQSLARSLRNARERTQRFEATGMFQPSAKTLDSGLDQDTHSAIAATLNGKLGHLQTQVNLYQNGALRVVVWVDFDVFIGAAAYR